jgi:hypothetical protein
MEDASPKDTYNDPPLVKTQQYLRLKGNQCRSFTSFKPLVDESSTQPLLII